MPRTRTPRNRLGVLLLLGLTLAGCTGSPTPTPARTDEPAPAEPLPWTQIALPPDSVPSSLTTASGRLLVGGSSGVGEAARPALLSLVPGRSPESVRLRPHSPYAAVADLVALTADRDRVVALGAAHGGAHANFRWTVWTGSPGSGLDDQPQTFETFGGQSAGSLLGVASTSEGPVIAGSWSGRLGLDAALWRPDGSRWEREDSAGTALANQPELQVAPRSVASDGARVLLAGSVITFAEGVQQRAALWASDGSGRPWTMTVLPESGGHSEALSTRCARTCWVSGHVDGEVALWSVLDGQASRRPGLPRVEVSPDGPGPQTVLLSDQPVVLSGAAAAGTVLTTDGDRWRRFSAPPGEARAAAVLGDHLYAVIGTDRSAALWTTVLGPTRSG